MFKQLTGDRDGQCAFRLGLNFRFIFTIEKPGNKEVVAVIDEISKHYQNDVIMSMEAINMTPKRKNRTDHAATSKVSVGKAGTDANIPYSSTLPPEHPGATLLEFLQEQVIGAMECAERCGLTERTVKDLLDGYIAVDEDIAAALEAGGFGPSAEYWLGKEWLYQKSLEHHRQTRPERLAESPAAPTPASA